jgi:hypothetical protein
MIKKRINQMMHRELKVWLNNSISVVGFIVPAFKCLPVGNKFMYVFMAKRYR